ncbi:MAG TPA: AAA family ATPase [Paracoccus sp. (in: a-proteobacteria)]|nr:AAA family ATPase [Paracoccus sp. (in: a-proteobacteria)]
MMRLRRLDLTRYGKFTDRVLDFGPPSVDAPDLHVVFGPNEAGKSTLLSAWMDLLYGIPARTSHDFIHPYASMRLGAALELPDGLHEVVRLKRNQNSLTDPQGRALPESVLRAGLGGLDRAAYETMFSLDDDTLAEGGDSILSSKGDLGQLLFSASAGLAELGQRLDGLRVQADAFHKKRAQRTRIRELRDELQALADEAAELDTQAGDYARLRQAAQAARAAHDAALEDVARAAGMRDRLRGRQGALPLLAEWREAAAELAPLDGLPEVPADWHTRIDPLIAADIRLRTEADLAARRAQELAAELAQMPGDPQALALADRAAEAADLRSRHRSARDDLPRRQQERDDLHRSIADLAAALGPPGETDPARLVPDAATLGTLEDLLAGWSGIAATLASAAAEAQDAAARLQDAGGALEEGDDPLARRAQTLRAALAPLRRSGRAAVGFRG